MEKRNQNTASVLKVVLYGPESTGKTTMAKALAAHYNTEWVPEFARDYLQEKWDTQKETCTLEDLSVIAQGQLDLEAKALKKANRILFCDTNILVTKVWSETHFDGYCSPALSQLVKQTQYDMYLLTGIDVPWEKDDLRDRPNDREEMFTYFKTQLAHFNFPYTFLTGNHHHRLKQAITVLDSFLGKQAQ